MPPFDHTEPVGIRQGYIFLINRPFFTTISSGVSVTIVGDTKGPP